MGLSDEHFDCFTNSYMIRKSNMNWMFWNVGNFYDVQGIFVQHTGSYGFLKSGGTIDDIDQRTFRLY